MGTSTESIEDVDFISEESVRLYLRNKNSAVSKISTVQCEGWCDNDLYCWYWYADRPDTNNDLNGIAKSPLFRGVLSKKCTINVSEGYEIQLGDTHNLSHFWRDRIYPNGPIFVLVITKLLHPSERQFLFAHESVRKDIERLCGILQSPFEIIGREIRRLNLHETIGISNTFVKFHNILIFINQATLSEHHGISVSDFQDI